MYIPYFDCQEFRPCLERPEKLVAFPAGPGPIRMEDLDTKELAQTWLERLTEYFEIFIIDEAYPDFLQTVPKSGEARLRSVYGEASSLYSQSHGFGCMVF